MPQPTETKQQPLDQVLNREAEMAARLVRRLHQALSEQSRPSPENADEVSECHEELLASLSHKD